MPYGGEMNKEMKKWQEDVLARLEALESTVDTLVEGEKRDKAAWETLKREDRRQSRI